MNTTAPAARLAALFVAVAVAVVAAAAAEEWAAVVTAVVAAGAALGAIRSPETLLGLWFAAGPWASYLLRFPVERSVVTFDRVMVLAISAGLLARAWRRREKVPPVGLFEVCWACYAAIGVLNALALSNQKPYALRVAVDAFAMPILLFYALRSGFDPKRGARPVFWGSVVLALSLPWAGLYEFATARDVLPYETSSILRAGVVRANGPFSNDNSYAIVSALLVVFLVALPRLVALRLDAAARALWRSAIVASGVAAVVPIMRTVVAAVVAALALPYALAGRVRTLARAAVVGLVVAAAAVPVVVYFSNLPVIRERFADASSAYSRLATYRAAVDIIGDHPLVGVGMANYRDAFREKYGTVGGDEDVDTVSGEGAEETPHSNVLGTWAELGVAGLFFYLAAALALAREAWRRRSTVALSLMVVYWLPGLTLQSGYYSDLTLYYFAMLAVALVSARDRALAAGD